MKRKYSVSLKDDFNSKHESSFASYVIGLRDYGVGFLPKKLRGRIKAFCFLVLGLGLLRKGCGGYFLLAPCLYFCCFGYDRLRGLGLEVVGFGGVFDLGLIT